MKDKKKFVYECDICHEYFEEGFQYKTIWTEVGANEPTEYYTYLCVRCFDKWRNERINKRRNTSSKIIRIHTTGRIKTIKYH